MGSNKQEGDQGMPELSDIYYNLHDYYREQQERKVERMRQQYEGVMERHQERIRELQGELAMLRYLVTEALNFDHAAGCSGGLDEKHTCKCGYRDWKARALAAFGRRE